MSLSADQFWRLAADSQLADEREWSNWRAECQAGFAQERGPTAQQAAEWLVKQRHLTSYQARRLLAGKSGPFQFGEYRILQSRPFLSLDTRRFEGVHVSTHHRLLLWFWLGSELHDWAPAREQAERSRRFRHPHLARCYEAVELGPQRFAVGEWPEGVTIEEILRQRKRLGAGQACLLASQVAAGLAHLHALGGIHGAIHAREVVVQTGGHVRLLCSPFGPSTCESTDPSTHPNLRPAADYWAPELIQRETRPDRLTDIYALGCLLYQLLAGQPPFGGATVQDVMREHATRRIETLTRFPNVSQGLQEIVAFMMAKRRDLRYQDLAEVMDKLEPFVPSGVRQTTPRGRATEPYFLSHLDRIAEAKPEHLAVTKSDLARTTDVEAAPPATDAVQVAPVLRDHGPNEAIVTAQPPLLAELSALEADDRGPRRAARKRSAPPLWLLVTLACATLAAPVMWWRPWASTPTASRSGASSSGKRSGAAIERNRAASTHAGSADGEGDAAAVTRTESNLVDDDGDSLWQAPTSGPPLDLRYTPAGAQFFLHVRLAELCATVEGAAALDALGPELSGFRRQAEADWGIAFSAIQTLLVSLVPQDVGPPRAALVLRGPAEALAPAVQRMTQRQSGPAGDQGRLGSWAVWLPDASGETLVLASDDLLSELVASPPEPLLRRQIEQLRRQSDQTREFTLLFTPNFLAADGRDLLAGSRGVIRDPLLRFFGDAAQAVCVSAHLSDTLYLELRWLTPVEESPLRVAADRRRQLVDLPERVNDYLGQIRIDPYWQPLAIRYPLMVSFLSQQARVGVEGRCAVINAVLPAAAAHNLLLASELALASSVNADVPVSNSPRPRRVCPWTKYSHGPSA